MTGAGQVRVVVLVVEFVGSSCAPEIVGFSLIYDLLCNGVTRFTPGPRTGGVDER